MNRIEYKKHLEKCSDKYYNDIIKMKDLIEIKEDEIEELEYLIRDLENNIEEINELLDDLEENYADYNYIPYDYKLLKE